MSHQYDHMMQAILLAQNGLGYVSPNPLVGAVLVHQDRIIGAGYHMSYGEAHAEVNCLSSVTQQELIPESTLYVTLEPCAHHGKTPPCTDLILKSNIQHVVIGTSDPNPLVHGKGIQILREHGVNVEIDIAYKECARMNRRFLTAYSQNRPYIILKWAQTQDGFIAPLPMKRIPISNDSVNKLVHQWRAEEDAIWVGHNTALIDDPILNVRLVEGKNPLRIVTTSEIELLAHTKLLSDDQPTFIFCNQIFEANSSKEIIPILNLNEQLKFLHEQEIQSVIVEGGKKLIQEFIDHNLWDEARVIHSQHTIQSGYTGPKLCEEQYLYAQIIENNTINFYKNKSNKYL
jgi:diaminohydroxyphosphoribosylaminopyrimidine deaminase/5-amino-6-(5-phosphoribosylamino)uracil reductase